ncbi:MAG TPA: ribosome recycling factor [Alphaproteobacteria bacterium]|nr:ribosome recycling factor [Alphaproteobacteria bacterium]
MIDNIIADTKEKMEKSEAALKQDLASLRTGRASTDILNGIMVDAYGSKMPLTQVGNVSVVDTRMLSVTVWDMSMVEATDKSIRESGLGFNPSYEGNVIRIPLPELTEDRRKELVKVAHKYAEAGKVAIRNVRRDAMDKIKKSDASEDEQRGLQDEVQKLTDTAVKNVDSILAGKEKEILTV